VDTCTDTNLKEEGYLMLRFTYIGFTLMFDLFEGDRLLIKLQVYFSNAWSNCLYLET